MSMYSHIELFHAFKAKGVVTLSMNGTVYMHANVCMYKWEHLPKMRLQMAFLAILMFWNDPKM